MSSVTSVSYGTELRSQSNSDRSQEFLAWLVGREEISQIVADRVTRVGLETDDRVVPVLLKLGLLSEGKLADALSEYSHLPRWVAADSNSATSLEGLSPLFLRSRSIALTQRTPNSLSIACWDPLDDEVPRLLAFSCNTGVVVEVATRTDIHAWLAKNCPSDLETPSLTSTLDEAQEVDRLKDLASNAPVIRWVQDILDRAISARSSDVHLESSETGLKIRFRQDGLLRDVALESKSLGAAVISRVKLMSSLDIAESRLPQDGRLRATIQGKEVDFRVACIPGIHGESIVLRILDRQDVELDFHKLGFNSALCSLLREAIARPHGIVLITGPTGSGKTTTLYAALKEINTPERKLLTVEDPVEYMLDGITQVPVRPAIGLSFAQALRSFLRQDPDVLMVGEIRDRETAEIAVQAALTGHLLLSTLHTNSAAAAMSRLLDMGVDDFLLTSTLHLVVGQRLVRRLCASCRVPFYPEPEQLERAGLPKGSHWYRADGCIACQGLGFKGRTAIIEALPLSPRVRTAVLARQDALAIEAIAIEEGMRTMYQHGIARVLAGETTFEEVVRVTSRN